MKALLFVCLTACAACPSSTPNPPPTTVPEASVALEGSDVCAHACDVLRAAQCPEGFTVDGGESCEVVCRHAQQGAFDIKPACIAAATNAAQVQSCGTVRCAHP
jgi:hypothetical protein